MRNLNPKILEFLSKKTSKAKATIRKNISLLRSKYPSCTLNAVAHIYAMQQGTTVLQKLDEEDRESLPNLDIKKKKIVVEERKLHKKEKIIQLIKYDTDDYFIMGHIHEINRAYTKECYTAANILARKVIENLIIDILREKFPPTSRINKELYYDTNKGRFKDFSVILDNLYKKRNEFGIDGKKIIERLHSKAKKIKQDANDKTHSWFYLVERKKEIDDLEFQVIIELIKKLKDSI